MDKYKYDIIFSFAGEDRSFVNQMTKFIDEKNIKYFYDEDRLAATWGKDLAIEFDNIYQKEARFCVIIISKYYKEKIWTNHELKSALARAIKEKDKEYILPIRLDDTEIPGIRPTLGFIDGRKLNPEKIVLAITQKLQINIEENVHPEEDIVYIPKVRRTISDLEKKKFLKSSFIEIKDYFQNALIQLRNLNNHLETEFEEITTNKFIVTIYAEGEIKSKCKIWIGGIWGSESSISFSEGTGIFDINNDSSMNDSARVTDDGIEIYFDILGITFGHLPGVENVNLKRASAKDVAKYYWGRLTNYLRN